MGESSTIGSGATNGPYPIRELSLKKSNETNSVDFVAPDSDKYGKYYDSAWDLPRKAIIHMYAIRQKFIDQTISADVWYKVSGSNLITSTELLDDFLYAQWLGVPNRYYTNSNTSKDVDLNASELVYSDEPAECEGCKL